MTGKKENAVIVFVKNPAIGKVKTRLAASVGEERAYNIYIQLLSNTLTVASMANADLIISYSDFIPEKDEWTTLEAQRTVQKGSNLGESMESALEGALKTYKRAILIGTDCGQISTEVIDDAIEALYHVDTIIGPAVDGGYYLVGAVCPIPLVFENIDWSTSKVLYQTLSRMIELRVNFGLGIRLRDVDTLEDWEALMLSDVRFAATHE